MIGKLPADADRYRDRSPITHAHAITVPVLVLTARGSWHEKVQGIDGGADDYVAKPFRMEEVLASHPAVAECAVIGVHDDFKGQVPRGFVVLKAGVSAEPAAVSAELVQLIRDRIGPVAALKQVDVVAALPKTRSGKILRKTMRGIADGADEAVPSTIEDPAVLDALRHILSGD